MTSPTARALRFAAALLGGICAGSAIRYAVSGDSHWPWAAAAAAILLGTAAAATYLAHRATRRSFAAQRAALEHLRGRAAQDHARAMAGIEAIEKLVTRKNGGTQP